MRTTNKITRERNRVAKGKKHHDAVLYFAQDPQVSSRILAVLHYGAGKHTVPVYETSKEIRTILVYNKKTKKKEEKVITCCVHKPAGNTKKEIERFRVICGSNGKIGTWYNTIVGVKDFRQGVHVSEVQKHCRIRVGRKLSNEEVVEMFPQQCQAFQKIFQEEYQKLVNSTKK